MKKANCSRCGRVVTVPNYFDKDEDMEVCPECDEELDRQWAEAHMRPAVEDTEPL